jgi:hypothetical protein
MGIAGYSFTTAPGLKPIERPVTIVVTHNAQRACLSMNGSPVQTIITGGYNPWNAGDEARLGNIALEGYNILYGFWTMGAILPYVVADADLPSLSDNPWQLFAPAPRPLYFDLARPKGTMRPTVWI